MKGFYEGCSGRMVLLYVGYALQTSETFGLNAEVKMLQPLILNVV